MKLKVVKDFFDKKENKYVYLSKTPTIEREDARAQELMAAGVAEEYVEGSAPKESVGETEESVDEQPKQEARAQELMAAGVAEEYVEGSTPEESVDEQPEQETPAEEKPAKKGGKK